MKLLDSTIRHLVPGLGMATRWLKEELRAAKVKVLLSAGCLEELVKDADAAAWRIVSTTRAPYLTCLREQIVLRARFVQKWTGTDEPIDAHDPAWESLVRIARAYALPRPWKLSEPVVMEYRRPPHLQWQWAPNPVAMSPSGSQG
jgi:hypothetical protein